MQEVERAHKGKRLTVWNKYGFDPFELSPQKRNFPEVCRNNKFRISVKIPEDIELCK